MTSWLYTVNRTGVDVRTFVSLAVAISGVGIWEYGSSRRIPQRFTGLPADGVRFPDLYSMLGEASSERATDTSFSSWKNPAIPIREGKLKAYSSFGHVHDLEYCMDTIFQAIWNVSPCRSSLKSE